MPLENLRIDSCDSLKHISRVLPPRLKYLSVSYCRNLTTLIYEGNSSCTSLLKHLYVASCPSLTSLWSESDLPATLEFIRVCYCSKLGFLSSRGNLPKALKTLDIGGLSELESIAQAGLENNKNLEIILITDCQNVKVLPDNLHKAEHLQRLEIISCGNLVYFSERGLPKKLTELQLHRCDKLKALPNRMHNLTSLQKLTIIDCPSIEFVFGFGFPTNLVELSIDYDNIYKSLSEYGFDRFTSIRKLELNGGKCQDVVSFPPEDTQGMELPTSLKELSIKNLPNLKRLFSIAEKLTSMEHLLFFNCPKLQYLPENGLPSSLLQLQINRCPLIKERCKKDKGQYWSLIAHLPSVIIDYRSVFTL